MICTARTLNGLQTKRMLKSNEQEGNVYEAAGGGTPSPNAELWQVLVLPEFAKVGFICPYKPAFTIFSTRNSCVSRDARAH